MQEVPQTDDNAIFAKREYVRLLGLTSFIVYYSQI